MIEAHIAPGTRRTGQFDIPGDKVVVVQVVARDSGRLIDPAPSHTVHKGPSGSFIELGADAAEYLILKVDDKSAPKREPRSLLREWQRQVAEAQGAGSRGREPSPAAAPGSDNS